MLSASAQIDYPFPWNPDADMDGWVSTEDLLQLLTVFGTQFEADAWETDSIGAAVVLEGNHNYFQCQSHCNGIEGHWKMADLDAFGRHFDLANSFSANFWVNGNEKLNSSDFAYETFQLYGPTGDMSPVNVSNFSNAKKCMCYIQSSPYVPNQYSEDPNFILWDSVAALNDQVVSLHALILDMSSDVDSAESEISSMQSAMDLLIQGPPLDTTSVTVNFPFGPEQPSNQLVEYAPLSPLIYVTASSSGQFRYADLILPTDSVPNGFKTLVVNVSNLTYGVDVEPNAGDNNEGNVMSGRMTSFLHYEGLWYPIDDE
jgi:hypothetical protein